MEKHQRDLYYLISRDGLPVTEELLCRCLWGIFRSPGEPIPWYFFHESGKGVYNNLVEETEFDWELSGYGTLIMESEGSAISFQAKHYRGIFMGLFNIEREATLLLFDPEGTKEQMVAFSN